MAKPLVLPFSLADLDDTAGHLVPTIWPDFINIFRREITAYFELPDVFWPDAFIVRHGQTVVGFAQIITSSLSHEACELCWVMVHPDHRRQGIGEALVAAAVAKASERQQTMFFATFRADLYAKLGLQPVGEWKPGRHYFIVPPKPRDDQP